MATKPLDLARMGRLLAKGLDPFEETRPRVHPPLKVRPKRAVRIKQRKRK